jgi:zinc protease
VLDTGLTVIVHEDHKAPIVAINTWYHVGSKNEKLGKTGFAHLFEHLMFGGSEHAPGRYIDAMEKIGATDLNGTTNNDRTNYFENVPTSALDYTLWMESDRMGFLLGSLDQKTLDLQRGVVQNEKRQGENQPYAVAFQLITQNTYPAGHPYSWTVIGDMGDLNAASMDDVKEWFRTYYGPSNVTIVLAGDIDLKTAKEKVEKYFGNIPPGPPVAHQEAWVAKMTGTHRQIVQDRVPQARIYKVWNVPQYGTADADYLDLASDVLSSGKSSRFYKRLVYDDQIATNANAFVALNEIAGQFRIQSSAKPGGNLAQVEKDLDEELAKFLKDGPTEAELARAKAQHEANFVRGIERIGGFGGKSDRLAQSQTYLGSPDAYKNSLKRIHEATTEDVKAAANRWLSDGVYILEVQPFPPYKADAAGADRSKAPEIGAAPSLKLPKLERATLSNGLKVILAQRHEVPLVTFWLDVDAGYAADQSAAPGTSSMTMALLNASFPEEDFKRQQRQQIAGIQREKTTPVQMGLRVFPTLLYGEGHAYGNPMTGTGTTATVEKMTREDMVKFHDAWFKPNHATLVIAGDTTLAEITPKLEKLFAGWKPGATPVKKISTVQLAAKSTVYLIDKPGAQQTIIMVGNIAPPTNNPSELAIQAMNDGLGGLFMSRINANLREDKHWSYGTSTLLFAAREQRPWLTIAPVQTDKTKESLAEVNKEFRAILTDRPLTAEELTNVQNSETLSLPGSRETQEAVGDSINDLVHFGLPDDYYDTMAAKIRALKPADMAAAAKAIVHPDNLIWVIVGDRAKIEAGVKELNLGEIKLLDADGKPL